MSRARNLSRFKPSTTGLVANANIASSAAIAKTKLASLDIVNADINASAAIASTKLGTMATANMPVGSILQIKHYINNSGQSYGTTTSGNDFVDTSDFAVLGTNSNFLIMCNVNHGVPAEENNNDSHDIHFFCMRTANSTHAYVGNNNAMTRTTGNAPSTGKWYSTDVPFAPSRGLTPAYGNSHDSYHRSMTCLDTSANVSAGGNIRYRIRMFNQSTMYINRARGSTQSGGVSSICVMEIQT